ncbi:MAG: tetratricopeptide repeat protein [Candidatus Acidiferrum sp.]
MITLALLATLAFPPQLQQSSVSPETKAPVAPEQVRAWQLEGLTQEQIREEVNTRGLTECAEEPLVNALSAARADVETVRVVRHAKAPCTVWKLGLRWPSPTDYLYELAGAVLWSDWGHALQTMQVEANKQPRDANVHLIYAHLLRMSEDWIPAYSEATKAVRLAPESPYAHAQRSTICYHSQLTECAIHEAQVYVGMRPKDAAAYITLGHARELQGHDDEAVEAYNEANKLCPAYAEIHAGFGRIYGRAGEFEKAVGAFEEAIRLDGNDAEYYGELAKLYAAEGDTRRTIEKWKQAKELEPQRAEISVALGNAYVAAGRYSEAVREYQEVLVQAPDIDGVRPQLAAALRALGRDAEAEQVYAEPAPTVQ